MIYLYTAEGCSKCKAQKVEWDKAGIAYEERSAERIKNPQDEFDKEALVQASIQNMELPVIVNSNSYNSTENEGSEI